MIVPTQARHLMLAILFSFIVAGCTKGEVPSTVATDIPVEQVAAAPELPPVTLVAPLPDASSTGASVTLEWDWIRKLNPDERYDVRVWKEGEPELGITLVSQPYLNLNNWLIHQTPGRYNWRVLVVQVEDDQPLRSLTPDGEARQFSVENVDDPALALDLPDGFQAELIAATNTPTSMAMDEAGNLYISLLSGDIVVQTAAERGTDMLRPFASGFDMITGILFHEQKLYVSSNGQVTVLQDTNGDFNGDSSQELFTEGELPGRQYDSHSNNGMVIGDDGSLYIPVGGTSDHGPEEHPLGGTVLRYDLENGTYEVFAGGLRNPYDMAVDAEGNLYLSDNGPDAPDLDLLSVPPDEINLIEEGKHYGYPDFFGVPRAGSGTEAPVIRFPASSAPTGMVIYDGQQFPAEYDGAIFTALWGNAAINHPTGHRIAIVMQSPDGSYEQENLDDFARGLRRPIEVIQTNDGSLIIADFETGQIFEIEYVGE